MIGQDEELGIKIHFSCDDMDLRDISIVSDGLHRAFNEAFAQALELHLIRGRQRFFLSDDDPLLVSLVVTRLSYGSLNARTKVRLLRVSRDLAVGAMGSILATAVISIGTAAYRIADTHVGHSGPTNHAPPVDVGPHIRDMAKKLAAGHKSWEMTVEDEASGTKVVIRVGRN